MFALDFLIPIAIGRPRLYPVLFTIGFDLFYVPGVFGFAAQIFKQVCQCHNTGHLDAECFLDFLNCGAFIPTALLPVQCDDHASEDGTCSLDDVD